MKPEEYEYVAEVCRMLADKTRVSMISILSKGHSSVGDLCAKLDLPQPTVSHHLALLRLSRVVERKRQGRSMHYSLNHDSLSPVKQFLAAHSKMMGTHRPGSPAESAGMNSRSGRFKHGGR
jgi:DNA-binding transcriptional ArsR family regulator